jgi:hypothetical protein
MSCGDQDGVDAIACGAGEVITFQQAIGFGVADDRLRGDNYDGRLSGNYDGR